MTIGELVAGDAITIGRNESLVRAKELMRDNNVRHLLVLEDAAGCAPTVCGVLSERDLLRAAMSTLIASGEKAQDAFLENSKVKEAMTSEVHSVPSDTPIEECAKIMIDKTIGCLPVIDEGTAKGIVTRTDLLGVLSPSK